MYKNYSSEVAIIDYGLGNLFSVKQACEYAGLKASITSSKESILSSDAAILPGVGAFGNAIANLEEMGLIDTILRFIESKKPFLGICLGMQLLFTESEEFGRHKGLDVIRGNVVKFPANNNGAKGKVPQVGWNRIYRPVFSRKGAWEESPLSGIQDGEFMYFVHSFYCVTEKEENISSTTVYQGIRYCSSILKENVFAMQFHPEKSAQEGLKIYKNWAGLVKKSRGG